MEKEFLRIGEAFGLRGPDIDRANAKALKEQSDKISQATLKDLESMTMTIVDGDFPREVLASRNLTFAEYKMPSRRNNTKNYDPKTNKAGADKPGILKLGAVDWSHLNPIEARPQRRLAMGEVTWMFLGGLVLLSASVLLIRRRNLN